MNGRSLPLPQAIEQLRAVGTNGCNVDVTTEDIVAKLQEWDASCSFLIKEIAFDRLTLEFSTLPSDVPALCRQMYALCPDVVEQNYGCIAEAIEFAEDPRQLPEGIAELIEGVDLDSEDAGLVLMARDLTRGKVMMLWWD